MNFQKYFWVVICFVSSICCTKYLVTDQAYLEVQHDGKYLGRITIGLFGQVAPKTVHNFKVLATAGLNGRSYEGSTFHRVIKRFMIQGGDIINRDGTNSISIYDDSLFPDENFTVKHDYAGFVSMANQGPDTNGCQFFITTAATNWLDGKHVLFGKVIEGQHVVHTIEQVKTDSDDKPLKKVLIMQSGILETPKPFYISVEPYTYNVFQWMYAGIIPLSFCFCILAFFQWVMSKLDSFKLVN